MPSNVAHTDQSCTLIGVSQSDAADGGDFSFFRHVHPDRFISSRRPLVSRVRLVKFVDYIGLDPQHVASMGRVRGIGRG